MRHDRPGLACLVYDVRAGGRLNKRSLLGAWLLTQSSVTVPLVSEGRWGRAPKPSRAHTALLIANGIGIAAAAVFSAAGARRPGYVTAEPATPAATFWAVSSAVRTWALAGPLLLALVRSDSAARSGLLVTAGLVQLGDAGLGVWQRNPAMATAPALMGAVHLLSARALGRPPSA